MNREEMLAKTTEKEFAECLNEALGLVTVDEPFYPFVTMFSESTQFRKESLIADQTSRSILMAAGSIKECSDSTEKYGLVWDGYVTIEGAKRDCIFIEYASNLIGTSSDVFAQPYEINGKERVTCVGKTIHMGEWTNRFFVHQGMGLLNKLDWDVLVRAPFVVLFVIAAQNGEVNENSIDDIVAYLNSVDRVESQSLQAAIEDGVRNHAEVIDYEYIGNDVLSQLAKTRETLGWYAQDNGDAFCEGLCEIAKRYSEKMGSDKMEVLAKIKGALSLT